jgi:hypothetical protein
MPKPVEKPKEPEVTDKKKGSPGKKGAPRPQTAVSRTSQKKNLRPASSKPLIPKPYTEKLDLKELEVNIQKKKLELLKRDHGSLIGLKQKPLDEEDYKP